MRGKEEKNGLNIYKLIIKYKQIHREAIERGQDEKDVHFNML